MKLYEHKFLPEEKGVFVFTIFFLGFHIHSNYLFVKKIKFDKSTYNLGLILGVPNVLAIHFLLAALGEVPAL